MNLDMNFNLKTCTRRFAIDKIFNLSGCSAVWLARFVRDEKAVGSNPATPNFEVFFGGLFMVSPVTDLTSQSHLASSSSLVNATERCIIRSPNGEKRYSVQIPIKYSDLERKFFKEGVMTKLGFPQEYKYGDIQVSEASLVDAAKAYMSATSEENTFFYESGFPISSCCADDYSREKILDEIYKNFVSVYREGCDAAKAAYRVNRYVP